MSWHDTQSLSFNYLSIIHCDVTVRGPILFILLGHCTSYMTRPVKPLNIEFGIFDTDILAKICDFLYFGPIFAQISSYDITIRYLILFKLLDHCVSHTNCPVKPLNIKFSVLNTKILAKIADFSYAGPKFASHCDIRVRYPILLILLDCCAT